MRVGQGNIEEIHPLTPAQEGILFHTLYSPDPGTYFQQYSCLINGHFDPATFRRSWQLVADRHGALRSLLTWKNRDRPLQIVRGHVELEWLEEDWRGVPPETQDQRLQAFLLSDREQGFELEVAPLMRHALFRIADDSYRFVWSHHHVILDGWSLGLVLGEVFGSYEQLRSGHEPALPAPFLNEDYVKWLDVRNSGSSETYWRTLLDGFSVANVVRVDSSVSPTNWAEQQSVESLSMTRSDTDRLKSFARSNGLTLNTLLRGAWSLVLSRYSGDYDVVFGATVSGRPPDLAGSLEMVGLFLNTLPVRVHIDPERTLLDWLTEIQQQQIEGSPHEATPLVDIQGWSRIPKGEPLFWTILVFENVPTLASPGDNLEFADVEYRQQSNYPIAVLVTPGVELDITILFDEQSLESATIRRILGQMERLLAGMCEDQSQKLNEIPFFPPHELTEILRWSEAPHVSLDETPVIQLIERAMEEVPEATAVIGEKQILTYGTLDLLSREIAYRLVQDGIGPDDRVGVCFDRSPAMMVGILGVLRSGAAYVPLDPHLPTSRLEYLLTDSGASAVVSGEGIDVQFGALPLIRLDEGGVVIGTSLVESMQLPDIAADHLAYVIYTSGSTGRPKGVEVTHRNLAHSTQARADFYHRPVQSFLWLSPFFFDSSVVGLFWTLCTKGRLVLPAPGMEQDVRHLASLIAHHGVTHILALPTLYELLLDYSDRESLDSLDVVIVAGEKCSSSVLTRHLEVVPGTSLYNEYGPTEATVWSTVDRLHAPCDDSSVDVGDDPPRVSIGRPIANTQVYIVDDWLHPVPVGVPGHLLIGGTGVVRGYLHEPALTEERFIDKAVIGNGAARLYKTGDIARFLHDGRIDLLGRVDNQVKIRGQRIELEEIESVLMEHPDLRDAVVVVSDPPAESALTAYVAPKTDPENLTEYLSVRLPTALVPGVIVALDRIPRGANGKIDRRSLPEPDVSSRARQEGILLPSGEVQTKLAEIWAGVLGQDSISVDQNFFELGGDSILSIRIIARAHEGGLTISPKEFFDHPTIEELARLIEMSSADEPDSLDRQV